MNTQTKKVNLKLMSVLFMLTYMISYITRINYGAIISEMEKTTGFSRSLLSMALTGSFVTYGTGQVVSGILGDKLSPKKLVTLGLLVSVGMNFLIPLCNSPYQMLGVWCINGFAQAFMWPPMLRIVTEIADEVQYSSMVVKISWGSSFGTIIVYLLSPLAITFFGWQSVFVFSAICGIIMIVLWNIFCVDVKNKPKKVEKKTEESKQNKQKSPLFAPFMIAIMGAIALQGMLRDSVTTWMPTYISETYNMSNIIAILTGVILPVFSIFCFHFSSKIYRKKFKSPVACGGAIFFAGAIDALLLFLTSGLFAPLSIGFLAILSGCMHGVNLMLITMFPPYFAKYGSVSTASGVLNGCTYVGSAVSTYGVALLSEKFGWNFTLLSWFVIALLGTLICFFAMKPWNKTFGKKY